MTAALTDRQKIERLALFLGALDEWGCEDNAERAEQVLGFIAGGFDLTEYVDEAGRPTLHVIDGGRP